MSFPVLMKLLGHTSPEMTMRYIDVAFCSGNSNGLVPNLGILFPSLNRLNPQPRFDSKSCHMPQSGTG